MSTTIRIEPATKARLDKRKVHSNQSYDEVIVQMVNRMDLQDEAAKHIEITGVRKK